MEPGNSTDDPMNMTRTATALLLFLGGAVTCQEPADKQAERDRLLRKMGAEILGLETQVAALAEPKDLTPREIPELRAKDFKIVEQVKGMIDRLEEASLAELLPRAHLCMATLLRKHCDIKGAILVAGSILENHPEDSRASEAALLKAGLLVAGGDPAGAGEVYLQLTQGKALDKSKEAAYKAEAEKLLAAATAVSSRHAEIDGGLRSTSQMTVRGALILASEFAMEHPVHPGSADFLARIVAAMEKESPESRLAFAERLAWYFPERKDIKALEAELLQHFEAEAEHGKACTYARRLLMKSDAAGRDAIEKTCKDLREVLDAEEARRAMGEPATKSERFEALKAEARQAEVLDQDFADRVDAFARDYGKSSAAPEALALLAELGLRSIPDRATAAIHALIGRYPQHMKTPGLTLSLARHYAESERWKEAATAYDLFLATYPDHPEAENAKTAREEALRRAE
jgi:hypothetical protein